MRSIVLIRLVMVVALSGLGSLAAAQESDERALDAERRALEAERRAVETERRALEVERRALEGKSASGGASQTPSDAGPQACETATNDYVAICSTPSRDAIGDAPQCAAAQAEMHRRCGASR